MEALDLTRVPVVDNHCHGLLRDQAFEDIAGWRQAFTESTDPGMPRDHVASTALYRRLIRTLASFLGCEPEEEAVFSARIEKEGRELTGALLRAANVDTLLLDTGFPPPEAVLQVAELGELGGCRAEPMLRLEILMESLLAEKDSLEDVKEALAAELDDVRSGGYVALKSIAAYRTGLDIREWPREEAEESFHEYRRITGAGPARLVHKPLRTSSSSAASASFTSSRESFSASRLSIRISSRSIGSARQPPSSPSSATCSTVSGGGKPVSRRKVSTFAARNNAPVSSRPSFSVRAE